MCPWKVHIFVSVQATKGQTVLTTRNEYVLCPLCADYRIVGWRARQSSELNPLALHQTHRCILYISTNLRCTYVVARDRVSRGPPHMPLLTWWRSCSLRRTLDLCTLCDCCLVWAVAVLCFSVPVFRCAGGRSVGTQPAGTGEWVLPLSHPAHTAHLFMKNDL